MKSKKSLLIFAATSLMLLSGCATRQQPLYSWGNYEDQLYDYFKGEPPEKQIMAMESEMNEAEARGEKLPPGFYAHLGLLYDHAGKSDDARKMLDMEKQNFPESAHFIDNLNSHFTKVSSQ